uniref:Uncharacterized protein n=1 Tax=Oryza rufipogon TaxID=4529 RepID=A0A0E0N2A1_ORYRU
MYENLPGMYPVSGHLVPCTLERNNVPLALSLSLLPRFPSLHIIRVLLTSELPAGAQPSVSEAAGRPRRHAGVPRRRSPTTRRPLDARATVATQQDRYICGGAPGRDGGGRPEDAWVPDHETGVFVPADEAAVSGTENHDHYGAAAAAGGLSSMLD